MKKQLAKLALTAALGLATALTVSCGNKALTVSSGKGGGDVQLLETVTDDQGNVQRFEYDNQNRIVKINDITITYGDNLITAGDRKFVINGNTVTEDGGESSGSTYTIDKYGYIVSDGSGGEYEYENFNLISVRSEYDNTVYSYDRMRSPFCFNSTPKWLIHLLLYKYVSHNNVVSVQGSYEGEGEISTSYKYEYDNEGYPVTAIEKEKHSAIDGITTRTIRYTYSGTPDPAVRAKQDADAAAKAAKKKRSVSKKEAEEEQKAAEIAAAMAAIAKIEAEKARADAEAAEAAEEAKVKAQAEADAAAVAAYLAAQKAEADAAAAENPPCGDKACPDPVITTFADARDGKTYKAVKIGEQTWMAENLNYQTQSGSWCYANNNSNCEKYGRLYDWKTAKTVCPKGWRLPSREDWNRLVAAAGGKEIAGRRLKSKSGWNSNSNGTDDYGFSALPGGFHLNSIDIVGENINIGYWWTATERNGGDAYFRVTDNDGLLDNRQDKSNGYSVRCVEN